MDIQICMVLFCICVVTGETSFWVDTVDSAAYEPRTSEKPTSWWEAANHECAKSDGHLFVPRGRDDLNLLEDQKVYWVGGFQYSYLKWTEDDTRYHTRVGNMKAGVVTPVSVQDNSPSNCATRCGNNHELYGLQRTSCYCLGHHPWRDGISKGNPQTEIRCPGDNNKRCGDDSVMTVYNKEFDWDYTTYVYRRVGYIYAGAVTPVKLQNNSAFSCDLRCGNNHRLYGLKGTSCYCLGYGEQHYNITERGKTEIRCPGDYDERCGDDSVMTVYKKDAIFVSLSPNGKCGYLTKHWARSIGYYTLHHLDTNCDKKRPYVCAAETGCSGSRCIRTTPQTWKEAHKNCTLAKSTNMRFIYTWEQYWIGLERYVKGKRIDGETIKNNSHSYYNGRRCVGVKRNGPSWQVNWYGCHLQLPALCNTVKPESTPSIGEPRSTKKPSTQVRSSTQMIRASTPVIQASTHGSSSVTIFPASTAEPAASTPTDSTPTSRQRTTSHNVKGFVNQETDKGEDHPSGFTVTYIVVTASVLAVGIVITLVIVFFKRQRRYCFKLEDERDDGVHYDTVAESLSCSPAGPGSQSATNEDACPCPERTVKKASMSTKKSQIPTENVASNHGLKQEESVYHVLEDTSPAKPTRIVRGSQRKDTTTNTSDKGACLEDEDQYNVLHGQMSARGSNSGMYAHLGQGEGDGVYDTTRQNTRRFNDTYQHTAPSIAPGAEDEDQYNVLRRERSQSAAGGSAGIYDHTTASVDQRDKAPAVERQSEPVVEDIYSQIDRSSKTPKGDKRVMEVKRDDTKIGNSDADCCSAGVSDADCCSAGVSGGNDTEHMYGNTGEIIGPCDSEQRVEDSADYYNIDSVRESKGTASKGGEEDGNNIYSLAHEFSDK